MAVTKFHSRTAVSRGCHKISFTHCCIAWPSQNFSHALLYRVAVTKFQSRTAVSCGCHKFHSRTTLSRGCHKISATHCYIAWLSQSFIHTLFYRVAVIKFHPRTALSRGRHKILFTHCCVAWLSQNSHVLINIT